MTMLYIDTSNSSEISVCVRNSDGEMVCEKEVANKLRAQTTLPLIKKLMDKNGLSASDIEEINVMRGPGSFTGLRVGISIANALSLSGLIKINGKELGSLEIPEY